MKRLEWNEEKNAFLKIQRGVSFEDVQVAIAEDRLLGVIEHPNKGLYPNQQLLIVNIDDYAYLIPFVEDKEKYFLKTIYPSRKLTKKYIINKKE